MLIILIAIQYFIISMRLGMYYLWFKKWFMDNVMFVVSGQKLGLRAVLSACGFCDYFNTICIREDNLAYVLSKLSKKIS